MYASDFWGCLKLPTKNSVDNLYHLKCKQIHGIQKQTTNVGLLLELGRVPFNFMR